MKILVATRQGGSNGIETYTRTLVACLRERGHEVVLAERAPEPDGGDIQLPGTAYVLRRLVGPLESLRVLGTLREAAAGCDVVHATYPEFVFGGGAVVTSVWHPHLGLVERPWSAHRRFQPRRSEFLFALSDTLALRRADAAVALTPAVGRALAARGIPFESIPPFLPDRVVASPVGRGKACILVAHLLDAPRKGLELAIEAVRLARARRPELELLLVGSFGDPGTEKRLPGFCRPLGPLPPDEVAAAIRDAGCFLFPSRWEEFGYVILEALAAGAPVACFPLAAVEELGPEDGVFVAELTAAGLSEALLGALDADRFEYPRRFRASDAVPRLERLYEAVHERTGGGVRAAG